MEDYPHTLEQLEAMLAAEEACAEYLHRLRWPQGFHCRRCGGSDAWRMSRGLLRCRACDAQTSVTAGTLFQGAHKPLGVWLRALWHVVQSPTGTSAKEIERLLGLGSYRTAWSWLHNLRLVMARSFQDRLGGTVEVDEAFIGGKRGRSGRSRPIGPKSPEAALIMIAVGKRRGRSGPIRIARLVDGSQQSLLSAVREMVDPSAVVRTDSCPLYAPGIQLMGYRHQPFRHYPGAPGVDPLPLVAEVAGELSEWLQAKLHGAVSAAHLEYYLAEFVFRHNHRASRRPGWAFHRLLQLALHDSAEPNPAPEPAVGATFLSRPHQREETG